VDGRIEAGFRYRFRELLKLVGAKRLDFGVDLLLGRGRERAAREGVSLGRALAGLYEETRQKVKRRVEVTGCSFGDVPWERFSEERPPAFLCDPSLGGLARWLRAAGYEAVVGDTVPGHRLPDEALRRGLVLLTTESEVLLRRIVVDGSLSVVWVPSALTMREQLTMVLRDLGLELRESRCMACGGELVATEKDAVFPRIPPRTAKWLDEYFVCARCDRLFWRGTHWERIARTLEQAAAS
jgi:uncharacterized protein with PIN domain